MKHETIENGTAGCKQTSLMLLTVQIVTFKKSFVFEGNVCVGVLHRKCWWLEVQSLLLLLFHCCHPDGMEHLFQVLLLQISKTQKSSYQVQSHVEIVSGFIQQLKTKLMS